MKIEKEVAIFIHTNENFFEAKFCIENLITKTKVPYRLYILNQNSDNIEFIDYLNGLTKRVNCFVKHIKNNVSLSDIFNSMIDMVYQKYIVFFPYNILVNENWLLDLIHSYECIDNSGCISIKNTTENLCLSSVLFKKINKPNDEMRTVYFNKTNILKDFIFFGTDKLKLVGKFNPNLKILGLEINEFTFRFLGHGFINYYIKYQNCLRLKVIDKKVFPEITDDTKENLKNQLNIMVNLEQYKK